MSMPITSQLDLTRFASSPGLSLSKVIKVAPASVLGWCLPRVVNAASVADRSRKRSQFMGLPRILDGERGNQLCVSKLSKVRILEFPDTPPGTYRNVSGTYRNV